MPINLRYGQQAVARGFLNAQRLQQVLAKQRQLAEQGKKVSVRMILEKAKLLDKDQLAQIDRDLNIKVVKKHTTKVQRPGVKEPTGRVGAQDFAGGEVPQFSGMQGADPDATVFSPPPPDMQEKVRAERERAKADARRKQEEDAAGFFGDDNASPFGGDPFGNDMQPEPFGNEMQPEPFGNEMQPEPFGNEMQPEPFGEMQPEPFGGGDLAPEPMGFGDDSGSPFDDPYAQQGGFGNEPAELDRMDSSPKLASLGAEYDGFTSPDEEELPTINAFDDAPAVRGGYNAPSQQPPQQQWGGPALAPASDDFNSFGNDIRSPEDLESAPSKNTKPIGAPDMDATMFSPPPPGFPGGRQKTGAMDRTVFSPRPPEFGGAQPVEPMQAQPGGDDWGEDGGFADEPFNEPEPFAEEQPADNMDATLFSPPPAQMPPTRRDTGRQQPAVRGRAGADDFGDVDLPRAGRPIDDVPTAPASMEDEVHPLRRGVGTSSASVKQPTGRPQPDYDDEIADELPEEGGVEGGIEGGVEVGVDLPEEDVPPLGKGKGKLPTPKKGLPTGSKRELPKKEVPVADPVDAGKEKKKGKRVLLIFVILLLVVVAILTLPVALYDVKGAEFVRDIRDNPSAKPVYDYVDYEIFNRIREWTGSPQHEKPVQKKTTFEIPEKGHTEPPGINGDNTPADNTPPDSSDG